LPDLGEARMQLGLTRARATGRSPLHCEARLKRESAEALSLGLGCGRNGGTLRELPPNHLDAGRGDS